MINLRQLRDAADEFKAAAARRDSALIPKLEALLDLDRQRREALKAVEALKANRNKASVEVARRKKDGSEATELLADLKTISSEIKGQDRQLSSIEHATASKTTPFLTTYPQENRSCARPFETRLPADHARRIRDAIPRGHGARTMPENRLSRRRHQPSLHPTIYP